jgi:HAD superfamily hydrolase (TIGR01509 family)
MTVGAFLFDLDGTLIDSMPLHHEAWRRWYAERDLRFDEGGFFEATAGRTNAEILADLFPQCSVAEHDAMAQRKEAIYRDLAERSLQPIAGFAAFHRAAREAGLALGICTAAPPDNMALAFRRFGLDKLVDVITSPADGLRGKPHPDIFVEAARRLGVAPPQCTVFEDAPLGIEAARRAGMRAVALTTSLPATAFAQFPNLVATAPDFTTLHVASLTEHNQVIHHA